MRRMAVSPNVAKVSKDSGNPQAAKLVNEAQLFLGTRPDAWIVVPVTVLDTVDELTVGDVSFYFNRRGVLLRTANGLGVPTIVRNKDGKQLQRIVRKGEPTLVVWS